MSIVEADYIVSTMASCEVVWLRKLFGEPFEQVLDTTVIYCNNKSGIRLIENLLFHEKSKHIDIWYHIFETWCRGATRLHHILTDEKIAYIVTMGLLKGKFLFFKEQLGLMDVTPPDKGNH